MGAMKDWSEDGINKMAFVRDWRTPGSIKMMVKKHGNQGYRGKITTIQHWSKMFLFVGLFLALSMMLVHVCDAEKEPARRKSRQALEVEGGGSKVPGVWSIWGPWSPCSQTCGLGIMERSRACLASTAETSWGAGVEPHPQSVRANPPFHEQHPGQLPYAARRPSYPLHTNGNAEVPPLLPSVPLHRHPEAYRPPLLDRFEPYPRHSRHQTFGRTDQGQLLLKPEEQFNQRTSTLRETEHRTEWGQHSNRDTYRQEGVPSQGTSYSRRATHRESPSTSSRRNVSSTMHLPLLRTPTKDSLPLFRPEHGELREISTGTFENPANPHRHAVPAAPTKAPRHSHRSWAQSIIKPGKYGYGKLPFALSLHRQVGEAPRLRGQQENPLSRKQKRKAPNASPTFSAEDSKEKSPQSGQLLNVSGIGEEEGKNDEVKGLVAKDEVGSTSKGMRLDDPTTHQKEESLTSGILKGPSVHNALDHSGVNSSMEEIAVRKADRRKRQSIEEENKAAETKNRIFLEDSSEEVDQDHTVENEKSRMQPDQSEEFLEEPLGEQLVSLRSPLTVPVVGPGHSLTIEMLAPTPTPAEAAEKEMSPTPFTDGTWTSDKALITFSPTDRSEEKDKKEAAPHQVDIVSSREASVINSDSQEPETLNKSTLAVALSDVNSGQNTATLDGEPHHQDGSIEPAITKSTTSASKLTQHASFSNEQQGGHKKKSGSLDKVLNPREQVRTTVKPRSTQQPKTHKASPSRQNSHQQGPKQIQNIVKFSPRTSSDLPVEEETRHRHRPPLTQRYSWPVAHPDTLSQTGQVPRSRHQRQQGYHPGGFGSRHPHSIFRDPPLIQRPAEPDTWLLQGENSALPHARGQGPNRDLLTSNEQQHWNLYHPGTETFHCEGAQKQYKACSQEPCAAGSVDSRAVQCATFDSQEFMGRLYQWEPFTEVQGYQRCELNCRPIGYRFYVRHTEKVQDGTPCEASSTDICVGGQCLRPGCDGILGSNKTLDDCGTCGGDGKACKLVVGTFNDTNVPIGYHKILQIPKGATKINVTEMTRSPNYLALRSHSGKSVINGNWAVDPPGAYPAGGTEFIYTRPGREENLGGESFVAHGPTTEALDVYMIFQQDNPGVSYRFFVSSEVGRSDNRPEQAHLARPDNLHVPAHHTRPNSPSLPANQARPDTTHVQVRQARPVNPPLPVPQLPPRESGALSPGSWSELREPPTFATHPATVSRNMAGAAQGSQSGRPHGTLQRNVRVPPLPPPPVRNRAEPLEFYWKRVGTTECSATCGKGFWLPIIRCVSRSSHEEVHEADCDPASRPAPSQEVCSTQPCPAFWDASEWSACSKSCGPGMQHRQVLCRQMYANRTTMVHPQRCSQLEKPNVTQSCQLRICSHWEISTNWTTCSVMCGTGQRMRNVRCISNLGDVLSEGECSVRLRPKTSESCDMGPCVRSWFHDDWSRTCSAECGTGIQRRSVVCLSSEVGGESGEACTGYRPADMRACDGGPCSRVILWYTGPWSQCSAECDDGTQRRDVICVSKLGSVFNVTDPSECGSLEKPPSLQPCNLIPCGARWYTTPWSACSRSCDGGHQVREVRCLTADKTFSRLCDLDAKPLEKRPCNTQMCALQLDENCKDKHQNCPLVVQARLCVYSYYKTSCCASCTRALERPPTPPSQ